MKRLVAVLLILSVQTASFGFSINELGDGLYLIEGMSPDTLYATSEDGTKVVVYLDDGSPADGIYLYGINELDAKKVYTPNSLIYKLWFYDDNVYFTEHIGPSRTVFAHASDGDKVILEYVGYDYTPLFERGLLFVCFEERGDIYVGGHSVIKLSEDPSPGVLPETNETIFKTSGYAYYTVADPDGGGIYFGLGVYGVYGGYVVARYDVDAGEATETGIPGIPLGTAFNGRSLVIEDEGKLLVINEDIYETEGVAGGLPVAFFGGGSQVFLRNGTISIGNLYEGKSSRVDFDLGDFTDIYFYPVSLKEIYFQIIRRDGTDETYKIEAEKGGFEVSPVEGSGLIIDMESRYSYFGG